jgi:hypothetical protein
MPTVGASRWKKGHRIASKLPAASGAVEPEIIEL